MTLALLDKVGAVARFSVNGAGGQVAITDIGDANWFLTHPYGWYAHREGNTCYLYESNRKPPRRAHRLLLGALAGEIVDHVNGNGLDIRRANLRIATQHQNAQNSRRRSHARSSYKGVWLHHLSGLYGGAVGANDGHRYSIGYYHTEEEAARAHDAVASLLHGEFAYLNLPGRLMSHDEMLAHKSIAKVYRLTRGAVVEEMTT